MEVEYKKKFLKELSKLPVEYAKTIEEFIFDDYRVGIKKENNCVIIETVKHRREIYKYFP